MSVAVISVLLASFMWATTNHIDKYLVHKYGGESNINGLLVFSSLVAGVVLLPITIITNVMNESSFKIDLINLMIVFAASITYLTATHFYLKALEKNDASIVASMFQLIPVFSFILTFTFFKENLSTNQLLGSIIIIISAILITLDFNKGNSEKKKIALLLMILSSFLYALYFFLFEIGTRNTNYDIVTFYYQIGFLLSGIILISIKKYRASFFRMLKKNGKQVFALNATNEAVNLVANLLVNFANTLIPLALATTLNGFQPAFVFIIGILGGKVAKDVFYENLSRRKIIQKSICIALGIVGLYIISN
jgi:drug/metabolite transporter (DMT)-like permease